MEHTLKREYGGTNETGWIQPTCSCGWVGRKEFAHNDYQHTNVTEQEAEHMASTQKAASKPGENLGCSMPEELAQAFAWTRI